MAAVGVDDFSMSLHFRLASIALFLATAGCATTGGVHFDRAAQVSRIVPVVELDLVGTDRFRVHGMDPDTTMSAEQLQAYFRVLFGEHNPRYGEQRYSIVLHSYNVPPPNPGAREVGHIAPVLAAARMYQCGVCIVYPAQAGINTVASYFEAFPAKRRTRR